MRKTGSIFFIYNHKEVVFSSERQEEAEEVLLNMCSKGTDKVLAGWGIDDPSEKDMAEAGFQAGYDACYELGKVNISSLDEEGQIKLPDGFECEVGDVLEKLEAQILDDEGVMAGLYFYMIDKNGMTASEIISFLEREGYSKRRAGKLFQRAISEGVIFSMEGENEECYWV